MKEKLEFFFFFLKALMINMWDNELAKCYGSIQVIYKTGGKEGRKKRI